MSEWYHSVYQNFMMMKSPYGIIVSLGLIALGLISCSDDEVTPDPTAGLVRIAKGYATGAGAMVELYTAEEFFPGYNPVWIVLRDSASQEALSDAHISLSPLMTMTTGMSHSCPVENPEEKATNNLFQGSVLFTMPSGDMGSWSLAIAVHNHRNNAFGKLLLDVDVLPTAPSRVIAFAAPDDTRYYIGHNFPGKLKVGTNPFEVIVFRREGEDYVPVENLQIKLEPEMPSMDHGSPNNEDPVHRENGHYSGVVNFTMTGEWRLNLTLEANGASLGTKYFDVVVE